MSLIRKTKKVKPQISELKRLFWEFDGISDDSTIIDLACTNPNKFRKKYGYVGQITIEGLTGKDEGTFHPHFLQFENNWKENLRKELLSKHPELRSYMQERKEIAQKYQSLRQPIANQMKPLEDAIDDLDQQMKAEIEEMNKKRGF